MGWPERWTAKETTKETQDGQSGMKSGQNAAGPREASRNLPEEATLLLGMSRSSSEMNIMLNMEKLMLQGAPPPNPLWVEETGSEGETVAHTRE